jgi:hypothetical protein
MNAVRRFRGASSPVKWLTMGITAISLCLFLNVTAQAGPASKNQVKKEHEKKHHDKKEHEKKEHKKKEHQKAKINKLKSTVTKDQTAVGKAQNQLALDSLPANLGGHPERIAADSAQLAQSIKTLNKDTGKLNKAEIHKDDE